MATFLSKQNDEKSHFEFPRNKIATFLLDLTWVRDSSSASSGLLNFGLQLQQCLHDRPVTEKSLMLSTRSHSDSFPVASWHREGRSLHTVNLNRDGIAPQTTTENIFQSSKGMLNFICSFVELI